MIDAWLRSFNEGLSEMRHGLQYFDLPDEDQDAIDEMREGGMTPDEALDVLDEVEDVK
jgi:hypothetical protein